MLSILMWFVVPGIVLGFGVFVAHRNDEDLLEALGIITATIAVIVLAVCLLTLPLIRVNVHARIAEFHSIRRSVDTARDGDVTGDIERAALSHKTVEANAWLARSRYYASRWYLDVFWPDEVMDLEPIR